MKQIGEFAKDNKVTIKALHHYEKLGLISPAKVDEFTGYRYYEESQSDTLAVIAYLKSLGLSLSEVKKILVGEMSEGSFISFLRAKKKQAEVDVDSSQARYHKIGSLIKALESKGVSKKFDIKEIIKMNKQEIKPKMTGHELFNYETHRMMEDANIKGKSLCALSVDIDDFASVNSEFSYEVGDIVIERIQNSIESALLELNVDNKEDYTIMAREGGDEFRAFVYDGENKCKELARNIIDKVSSIDYDDVADGLLRTVTVGIASNEWEKLSVSRLFHLAESAMYELKTKIRGTYKVYSE